MASRGDELNTRITATDDASAVVDKVAEKVGKLEDGEHDVDLGADTSDAEEAVRVLDRRLDGLTGKDREMVLKASARQAEREIEGLTRQLANAERYDDTEITMRVDARDKATQKLAAIRAEMKDLDGAVASPSIDLGGLTDQVGKIASAAGIGALLGAALEKGMDARQGVKRLVGQFRISAEEAAKYGKLAGELYSQNWGESLKEVQQNVALTARRLKIDTDAELREVSAGIFAVSDTWGPEFDRVVRSTSQLMQNGLARSATEALDLITAGFQAGADEAGDFLETIDEYSQHWAALGLSGEEALNQIVAGLQQGQRDTDKIADATKEFRLRAVDTADAVSEAYKDLGLDADEYRNKVLAGGDSAQQAFLDVVTAIKGVDDPIAQNKIAVQLLGTQYEDLGPTALDALLSIEGGLGDVQTATEDLSASIEATPWEKMQRKGENALVALGNQIAGVVLPLIDGLDKFNNWGGGPQDDWASPPELKIAFDTSALGPAIDEVENGWGGVEAEVTSSSRRWGEALVHAGRDAKQGIVKSAREIKNALIDAATGAEPLLDVFSKLAGESTLLDIADDFDSVRKAAIEAFAAEAEGNEDATALSRDHRQEVIKLVGTVEQYLRTLDGVPQSVKTDILTDIDQGRLDEALDELAALQAPGYKQIFIDLIDRSSYDQAKVTFGPGTGPSAPTFTPRPDVPGPVTNNTFIQPPSSPAYLDAQTRLFVTRNGPRPV